MSVDADTVKRIARLARIHVEPEALPAMAQELNGILNWIEMLREVDTTGVQPMAGGGATVLRWRDDVVTDGAQAEAVLANAPDREGEYFGVPKVVE
ncbi:MAG: Asp-tRNA(Asn)/Glu-tRNA(Gln) amidotransferase subunit GatC [Alphaproteobacteria bacterium]|jgi:aspartyl-tRNA(Asn)/glutamyl-tRNA(Gln) amidotransferase subunit C|nr:Asp-tRNA(Asn)/Glu-tRNA(Gln) amidotransferase subunit GatC [Alphaproteobacteria bacterium]